MDSLCSLRICRSAFTSVRTCPRRDAGRGLGRDLGVLRHRHDKSFLNSFLKGKGPLPETFRSWVQCFVLSPVTLPLIHFQCDLGVTARSASWPLSQASEIRLMKRSRHSRHGATRTWQRQAAVKSAARAREHFLLYNSILHVFRTTVKVAGAVLCRSYCRSTSPPKLTTLNG